MFGTQQESPQEAPWGCLVGIAEAPQVPIDPNGNLTQKTEGSDTWTYSWNAENQLTKVEKNGAEVARFAYDPKGRRVEKVAGGVTTSYTYEDEDLLREVRGATTLKYVSGEFVDEPLAVDDAAVSYFHADTLGSIVKVSSAAGAVMLTRQYDAWGNLESGAADSGYAFTGREWDPETGLYYHRARYYDPAVGNFVSEDPLHWLDQPNLYAYAGNDPVNWVDRSGEAPVRNCSGTPIPYKPENTPGIQLCLPGQTCDADGVYPRACDKYPIKIVDGCSAQVTPDGKLLIVCPFYFGGAPLKKRFPRAGQWALGGPTDKDFHDEHPDWTPPNGQPDCGCK